MDLSKGLDVTEAMLFAQDSANLHFTRSVLEVVCVPCVPCSPYSSRLPLSGPGTTQEIPARACDRE